MGDSRPKMGMRPVNSPESQSGLEMEHMPGGRSPEEKEDHQLAGARS